MLELTGLALLTAARQARADIPFIICTGYSDQGTEDKFKQVDDLTLLMKPVTRQELAAAAYERLKLRTRD